MPFAIRFQAPDLSGAFFMGTIPGRVKIGPGVTACAGCMVLVRQKGHSKPDGVQSVDKLRDFSGKVASELYM
jgi:hypothetical protein